MRLQILCALALAAAASVATALTVEETVNFPTTAAWGGGDTVANSKLVGRTYTGGNGPGIWIVADGGYKLYLNGELLAEDNAAGRVTFVPVTFLPGKNAVSVVGADGNGVPGVLVQIDELDTSYVSDASWKVASSVSDSTWKRKTYDDASWESAVASGSSSITPSGNKLSGFASGSAAKWIWASSAASTRAVLRFKFNIQAEGFGATTTGGDGGTISVLSDTAAIRKALQDTVTRTILVPEGTYDFRKFRSAIAEAAAAGYTWCKRPCSSSDVNSKNTLYRINFYANSCSELNDNMSVVTASDNLKKWDNWITTKANKSVIGMGRGAALRGVAFAMRANEGAKNQIYRNLALYDVNPHLVEGGDGLEASGGSSNRTSNLWADHISYKWVSDGMDMEYVTGATISWLDYDGRNEYNCYETDPYVTLNEDVELTYANNYWHATYGRVPKVTASVNSSKVHVYNSYLDTNGYYLLGAHGASSSVTAQILFENNSVNHAAYAFDLKESYGAIKWTGNTVANSAAKYYTNGTAGTTAPSDAVFSPGYSYVKKATSDLSTSIPKYAGMGGRWGGMPSYNKAFGRAHTAPLVSLSSPGDTISSTVTLSATASASSGSIVSVAFYAGTQLLGTASSSPYKITVTGLPAGVLSLVAIATDDSGLTRASSFVTVVVKSSVPTGMNSRQMASGLVRAHVTWLLANGERVAEETIWVDPDRPSMKVPAGLNGVALARLAIEGRAVRTLRIPNLQ